MHQRFLHWNPTSGLEPRCGGRCAWRISNWNVSEQKLLCNSYFLTNLCLYYFSHLLNLPLSVTPQGKAALLYVAHNWFYRFSSVGNNPINPLIRVGLWGMNLVVDRAAIWPQRLGWIALWTVSNARCGRSIGWTLISRWNQRRFSVLFGLKEYEYDLAQQNSVKFTGFPGTFWRPLNGNFKSI